MSVCNQTSYMDRSEIPFPPRLLSIPAWVWNLKSKQPFPHYSGSLDSSLRFFYILPRPVQKKLDILFLENTSVHFLLGKVVKTRSLAL